MILLGLCQSIYFPQKASRSFYYRHRKLLKLPCAKLSLFRWPLSVGQLQIVKSLSECAPAREIDFNEVIQKKLFRELFWAPQDPSFFKMLFSQSQVWKKYETHKLEAFLHSSEAKEWLKSAMALGRKPLFEFDRSYYPSKSAALNHSQRVRDLLREQPLLRYADLKELKIKNAQKIIEGFSALPYLRTERLKQIRASFAEI